MPKSPGSPFHLYFSPEAPQFQRQQGRKSATINSKLASNNYDPHYQQYTNNVQNSRSFPDHLKQKQNHSPCSTHGHMEKVNTYDSADIQVHSFPIHTSIPG